MVTRICNENSINRRRIDIILNGAMIRQNKQYRLQATSHEKKLYLGWVTRSSTPLNHVQRNCSFSDVGRLFVDAFFLLQNG